MTDANAKTPRAADDASIDGSAVQPPFFSAVLTPYRSLGPRGFLVLMLIVAGISFGAGALCLAAGAWPVFGFFGLDVALVWFAFRRNYRDARAYEEVHVSSQEVILRKVSPAGEGQVYRFNPAWLRIEVERLEDEGVTRLRLRSHGREVPLGDFLNPGDREDFLRAFTVALSTARAGGPVAPPP